MKSPRARNMKMKALSKILETMTPQKTNLKPPRQLSGFDMATNTTITVTTTNDNPSGVDETLT